MATASPARASTRHPTQPILLVHGALLLTAALWGGNFSGMKFLLGELSAVDVMVVRCLGAALFFVAVLLATGRPWVPMTRADGLRLVLIGVLGITAMNVALAYGLRSLSAGLASLIITRNPVFTVLIATALGRERLTGRKLAGIAVAFAGFLVVLQFGSPGGTQLGADQLRGVLILLLAPLSWAFYTVLSKPLLTSYPSLHVAAYATIAGGLTFLPVLAFDGGLGARMAALDARGWLAMFYVSVLSIVVAYILWYWGLRVLSPSQTAVYAYLVPVFGLLGAWLVLGDPPTAFVLLGGAVIIAGVVLTNSAPRARRTEENPHPGAGAPPLPPPNLPRHGGGASPPRERGPKGERAPPRPRRGEGVGG